MEGQVFIEFEKIPKKRLKCDVSTAMLPENSERNRFRDVVPYEDNIVKINSSQRNKTGYINASHISVSAFQEGETFSVACVKILFNLVVFHLHL